VNIFTDLIERTIKIDKALFKNLVLNFTDLNKPTNWHVRVIETLPDKFLESNSGKEIRQIVSSQKFNERNYKQLALWFSGAQIEDCSSGSKIIREIVEEFPVQSMIEWGSKRLVEICNDLKNSNEFIKLLPALDFFCNINTAPANINQIKEFRTMAYANVYERIFIDNEKPEGYSNIIDTDIIEIVNHVIYEKTRTNEEIIESYREKINSLENELLYIETQLKERSEAFGELSGGAGMNEKNLRYEERFKILKEFAGALSEIERFIINKNIESDEIKGILLRFENILKNFGVNKKGIINEKIIFDPKYCHIAEGEVPDRPAEVDVISTGYIIEGPEKDARVLIPAIVRN
jgi:molecular chaperone GrpE (heat shock protein)